MLVWFLPRREGLPFRNSCRTSGCRRFPAVDLPSLLPALPGAGTALPAGNQYLPDLRKCWISIVAERGVCIEGTYSGTRPDSADDLMQRILCMRTLKTSQKALRRQGRSASFQ